MTVQLTKFIQIKYPSVAAPRSVNTVLLALYSSHSLSATKHSFKGIITDLKHHGIAMPAFIFYIKK